VRFQGAAVATRVAIRTDLGIELQGLVNIDVVEGTAMEALPHMSAFLHQRPASFRTQNEAIKYMVTSGQLRKLESAKLSVPPQLRFEVEREVYGWRTDLEVRCSLPSANLFNLSFQYQLFRNCPSIGDRQTLERLV